MNGKNTFDVLKFSPLAEGNIKLVHEMCEKNVKHVSKSLETFKRATLGSDLFEKGLSLVAYQGEKNIAAFFMVVLREPFVFKKKRKVAVLKFFVVDENWRYKGIGSNLLYKLMKKLRNHEKKCFKMKFEFGTSMPDYWFPGLDPRHTEAYFFLKKHGFKKKGERINLCIDLGAFSDKRPPSQLNDIKISRATLEDKEELVPLKFIPKAYQLGFWPQETALSYKNDPISCFVAKNKKGRIFGFAAHSVHFPGSFGPTGVNGKLQGRGIGGLLLNWCLWDIKQKGLLKAKIMWVVGDTVYFYLKTKGAHICEFFWPMHGRI
ncbi:MAG: GNAT family N-acetyltransferase [Promethearchaeota archaeon]|nr:MAG: GNAT family N-acetyltransferase [Candidatus Lokiarchaeota archaeon]